MPDSFLVIVFVALVLLVFWRATLLVVAAVALAVIITGMGHVFDAVSLAPQPQTSLLAPGELPAPSTPVEPPR